MVKRQRVYALAATWAIPTENAIAPQTRFPAIAAESPARYWIALISKLKFRRCRKKN